MTVAVQRHRNVGVSQSFLHDLGMHPLRQQQRRTRVPQVVKPEYEDF